MAPHEARFPLIAALPAGRPAPPRRPRRPPPRSSSSGRRRRDPTPSCPAKPCLAVSRTTGYQAKVGATQRRSDDRPAGRPDRRLDDHARQPRRQADAFFNEQPRRRARRPGSPCCDRAQALRAGRRRRARSSGSSRTSARRCSSRSRRSLDGQEGLGRRADGADLGAGPGRRLRQRHVLARRAARDGACDDLARRWRSSTLGRHRALPLPVPHRAADLHGDADRPGPPTPTRRERRRPRA